MFLKLKVARKQYTDVYVQVPDGFDKHALMRSSNSGVIGEIAERTTTDSDWDDFGWEEDVEVEAIEEVSESKFNDFDHEVLDVNLLK